MKYKEYRVVINTNPSNSVVDYIYDPKTTHKNEIDLKLKYKGYYKNGSSLKELFERQKRDIVQHPNDYDLFLSISTDQINNVIKNGNGVIWLKRMPKGYYYDEKTINYIEKNVIK